MVKQNYKKGLLAVLIFTLALSVIMFIAVTPKKVNAATRYEAEDATCTEVVVKDINGEGSYAFGVSGSGFVGFNDNSNAKVSFNVNVSEAGLYKMAIKYATGDETNVPWVEIYVGSTLQGRARFPFVSGSGWGGFNTAPAKYVYVGLQSGANTVEIRHLAWAIELDYIEIGDKVGGYQASPINPTGTKYEAEDATLIDCLRKEGDDGYAYGVSGSGFVADLNTSTASVTFDVSVSEAATYELFIKYASGSESDASFNIYVNNTLSAVINLECLSGWGAFNVTPAAFVAVSIPTTTATIKVQKNALYAQIDYIVIGSKTSAIVTPPEEEVGGSIAGRYEAENATIINAAVKSGYGSGYTGSGFVGDTNSDEHYVEFIVNAPAKGTYTVKVCVATGGTDISVSVFAGEHKRGGRYQSYGTEMVTNKGWGVFSAENIKTFNVGLTKGENFIMVKGPFVEIDCIIIEDGYTDYVDGVDYSFLSGSGEFGGDSFGGGDDFVSYAPEDSTSSGSGSDGEGSGCSMFANNSVVMLSTLALFAGAIIVAKKRARNN